MRLPAVLAHARAWWPGRTNVDRRERLRAVCGAAIGLFVTAVLCRWLAGPLGSAVTKRPMAAPHTARSRSRMSTVVRPGSQARA